MVVPFLCLGRGGASPDARRIHSGILRRFRCLWYTKTVIYLGLGPGSCYYPSYPRYYPSYPRYYPRCHLSFIEP